MRKRLMKFRIGLDVMLVISGFTGIVLELLVSLTPFFVIRVFECTVHLETCPCHYAHVSSALTVHLETCPCHYAHV